MIHTNLSHRHLIRGTLAALIVLSGVLIPTATAQDAGKTTLLLRPHCTVAEEACPTFEVEDPGSLKTSPLASTDTLDLDIVLVNPQLKKINRVRAWLLFNPATIQGKSVDLGTALPVAAPGEKDISDAEGFVKIDVSPQAGSEPVVAKFVVARVQFSVKAIPPGNADVLAFYDIQTSGHTIVTALGADGTSENALEQDPSQLLIRFQAAASSAASSAAQSEATSSEESLHSVASESGSAQASSIDTGLCGNGVMENGETCDDGNFLNGDGCSTMCILETGSASSRSSQEFSARSVMSGQPDGSVCDANAECVSGLCSNGLCRGEIIKVENGGTCNNNDQCLSGSCSQGKCVQEAEESQSSATTGQNPCGILQVRNVRVTTQGSAVFLAWDKLASTLLNGYNIYYGTTSGRYIQRKSVDKNTMLIDIRALPEGTTYFFAVRGTCGEKNESAFSQEVAVQVGDPKTSTSPLKGNLLNVKKPLTTSETGLPSSLALLLVFSAITGTLLASRRQWNALSRRPRHD